MKIPTILIVTALAFVNTFNPPQQTKPQEPAELQEATTLTDSAVKLFNSGRYDEALVPAKRALQIREKLLPRTDTRISSALSNLGEIYLAQKDYKAAKGVYLQLLKIQEELYGPENVYLAFTLDRLALVHYVAGDDAGTEAAYKRALVLREKHLGPDDVQVAQAWFALAEFYRFRKKVAPAAESYKRSLELYGKLGKVMTPQFERASDGFACLGYENKPELWEQLAEIRKQFAPAKTADDSKIFTVLNGKAVTLPKPEYPGNAADRRLTGIVVVKIEVDETGNVVAARDMCQGPPFLSEAAVAAAWKARFTPTKINGQPVRVRGVIQYNFTSRFR
ncbi:MAG: TonB family protein [Acidobacteria bacterium]|nr:TonB family protein [Acidobacteriota bacterium]